MNIKNKRIVFCLLLLLTGIATNAQKLKYKDIFDLLETKQYEVAEPLLKQYLEKEQDNPSAFLYMGIILMDKYYKTPEAEIAKQIKNEAITSFEQAKLKLNEREVSKNEKYYSTYKRRNVRTGNMEVRLSDIVLDIDNRINRLSIIDKEKG